MSEIAILIVVCVAAGAVAAVLVLRDRPNFPEMVGGAFLGAFLGGAVSWALAASPGVRLAAPEFDRPTREVPDRTSGAPRQRQGAPVANRDSPAGATGLVGRSRHAAGEVMEGTYAGTVAGYQATLRLARISSHRWTARITYVGRAMEELQRVVVDGTRFNAVRVLDNNAELRLVQIDDGAEIILSGEYVENMTSRPIHLVRR